MEVPTSKYVLHHQLWTESLLLGILKTIVQTSPLPSAPEWSILEQKIEQNGSLWLKPEMDLLQESPEHSAELLRKAYILYAQVFLAE